MLLRLPQWGGSKMSYSNWEETLQFLKEPGSFTVGKHDGKIGGPLLLGHLSWIHKNLIASPWSQPAKLHLQIGCFGRRDYLLFSFLGLTSLIGAFFFPNNLSDICDLQITRKIAKVALSEFSRCVLQQGERCYGHKMRSWWHLNYQRVA